MWTLLDFLAWLGRRDRPPLWVAAGALALVVTIFAALGYLLVRTGTI